MASGDESCCGPMFWVYLVICTALVLFAGLMSGLTLGLMSLSLVDLEVLTKAGSAKDRAHAAKILPVVKNQHLLLCTLLIGNSLAMEALPIFLDALAPAWGAILISVTLILAFGEIIPQAVCSRYGLSVGAKTAPIVRVLLIVFFPVAYPISKLLDWLLGKGHVALMRRAELRTLVDLHGNEAGKGGELTHDETTIITGALDLTQKTAKDAMTPIADTFSLDINAKLDMYLSANILSHCMILLLSNSLIYGLLGRHTLGLIMTKGHSRVPIYSGTPANIIGLILVKNLITSRPEDEVPIRNVTIRKIPRVADDLPLYDILNEFQKGHSHMAVVVKRSRPTGIEDRNQDRNTTSDGISNNGKPEQDGDGSYLGFAERSSVHSNSSPITSAIASRSPHIKIEMRLPSRKSDRGHRDNVLDINSDALPSYSLDEEVVGIITMEDVMEELLQEEILDETDEYVDVHNKIKINMAPPKNLSSQSPLRSPSGSPFSPYHQILRSPLHSPLSPYTQAQIPTIFSPGKSPIHLPVSVASPQRVPRKMYERLHKNSGSKQ